MVRDRIPFSGWVSRLPKIIVGVGILLLSLGVSAPLPAQTGNAALSGIVTDPSGKTVPNARISVKSTAIGQTAVAITTAVAYGLAILTESFK